MHVIGTTNAPYSSDPTFGDMVELTACRRLNQWLQEGEAKDQSKSHWLRYPILQPFDGAVKPFTKSVGAVVVQVRFQDLLNNLPGFDRELLYSALLLP